MMKSSAKSLMALTVALILSAAPVWAQNSAPQQSQENQDVPDISVLSLSAPEGDEKSNSTPDMGALTPPADSDSNSPSLAPKTKGGSGFVSLDDQPRDGDVPSTAANEANNQTQGKQNALDSAEKDLEEEALETLTLDGPNDDVMRSLFFNSWEEASIDDAIKSIGNDQGKFEEEAAQEIIEKWVPDPLTKPLNREVRVGGIVYTGPQNWIVWVNGRKVTPKEKPWQIMDIRVNGEYIEMKWIDEWSRKVYPIRIRAHQRFNLDTRTFLPG